ncbi:hypothetical protein PROFUN_14384 [Planoprotostelium fungivorum]|uniref:Uncharacterized protein n=1 Tax=Planoprotostelium fungivorum TaxID=1890364 RepID=A0A2P6MVV6_9EUKA|nr:hypothetical protein PROFUN_14384 [Planoprotostelium fungivorum]
MPPGHTALHSALVNGRLKPAPITPFSIGDLFSLRSTLVKKFGLNVRPVTGRNLPTGIILGMNWLRYHNPDIRPSNYGALITPTSVLKLLTPITLQMLIQQTAEA